MELKKYSRFSWWMSCPQEKSNVGGFCWNFSVGFTKHPNPRWKQKFHRGTAVSLVHLFWIFKFDCLFRYYLVWSFFSPLFVVMGEFIQCLFKNSVIARILIGFRIIVDLLTETDSVSAQWKTVAKMASFVVFQVKVAQLNFLRRKLHQLNERRSAALNEFAPNYIVVEIQKFMHIQWVTLVDRM